MCEPSPYSTHNDAGSTLTGHTRPLQPSSPRRPSTADRKLPLYCSIIDSSRLPPVCPASFALVSSVGRRDSSTRRASPSLRASASAHFSTSPGGKTPSSSRSWPELPPLSNIVTTAFKCSQGLDFSPPSRLGRPVPPPKHPTFRSRNCIWSLYRLVEVRFCNMAGVATVRSINVVQFVAGRGGRVGRRPQTGVRIAAVVDRRLRAARRGAERRSGHRP